MDSLVRIGVTPWIQIRYPQSVLSILTGSRTTMKLAKFYIFLHWSCLSYFCVAFLGVGDNPNVVFPDAEALHPCPEVSVEGGRGGQQERLRPDQFPKQQFSISSNRISLHCKRNNDFPIPSRDVTNQTLSGCEYLIITGQEEFGRWHPGCGRENRLFFYSVTGRLWNKDIARRY